VIQSVVCSKCAGHMVICGWSIYMSHVSLPSSLWPLGRNSRHSTLLWGRGVCALSQGGGPEEAVCHLHLRFQQGANCRYCPLHPHLSLPSALRSFDRLTKPRRATLEKRLAMSSSAYFSMLQHTSAYVRRRQQTSADVSIRQQTSADVSIRQHTSAYVSRRQQTSANVSRRLHTSAYVSRRQHTSAYVSRRQHASACVSIRQHASAYVSIRQHASAYVSIRQHTSAYVSIRRHTSAYISIRIRQHLFL
jgi:hypothetical protein